MKTSFSPVFLDIMDRAENGELLNKEDLIHLLDYHEISPEADSIRSAANQIARKRFQNRGVILGQIGYETVPCPGNCQFCSFAKDYTAFAEHHPAPSDIAELAKTFLRHKSLFALFLMGMHHFNFEKLLRIIDAIKPIFPDTVKLVVNIGDFTRSQAEELRAAGVSGAYHVLRLREGSDTDLDPAARLNTIKDLREAGLEWYYCCEPIGPEHSSEELADQILIGREFEAFQHAAMRRVMLPNSPLAGKGIISEWRLAQIVAAVVLGMNGNRALRSIAVHEPNSLGLCSGANAVYAETGANPRDLIEQTQKSRGLSVHDCENMLWECGFTAVNNGCFHPVPLTM
ncbi:MAG: radical SAM protein [Planctomycetia bacterium]|nr:radical SAM protein [Planctomycetia bacterium]